MKSTEKHRSARPEPSEVYGLTKDMYISIGYTQLQAYTVCMSRKSNHPFPLHLLGSTEMASLNKSILLNDGNKIPIVSPTLLNI
jgi:hypothetical protein